MNLLITGAWTGAKDYINQIENEGHAVVFMQYEKDDLPCDYEWVEGIICNGLFLSHPIEKFVNLKYIQLTSAGFDRVPMDYVEEHNIKIYNARGVYSIPMAEWVVLAILELYKRAFVFFDNQKKCLWKKQRNLKEILGKTVLIIGCGSVACEVAKRLGAFEAKVIGIDKCPRRINMFAEILSTNELDKQLPRADIIILTVPLTDETYHLINKERLGLMKENAILINISRGKIIDEVALNRALENERIAGVALDVFEEEPLDKNSGLWKMKNVIITPHSSFEGEGNKERLMQVILENVKKN